MESEKIQRLLRMHNKLLAGIIWTDKECLSAPYIAGYIEALASQLGEKVEGYRIFDTMVRDGIIKECQTRSAQKHYVHNLPQTIISNFPKK